MRDDLTEPGVAARFKSGNAIPLARRLRKTMTRAETQLWYELRRLRGEGLPFRRQAPIGPFIVDFACLSAMLLVEIDGGAHRTPDVAARDVERQAWLEGRGFRVLRFGNAEVLAGPALIASRIEAEEARLQMRIVRR